MIEGTKPPLPLGWDQDFENIPQSAFNLVTLDSLNDPNVRRQIPTLRHALESWRDKDDPSGLIWRAQVMPRAQMPVWFLMALYSNHDSQGLPYLIVDHPAKFSAQENEEEIAKHQDEIRAVFGDVTQPKVLKTVSVGFPAPDYDRIALVSGSGDFRIDKALRRDLANELDLPNAAAKNSTVNPKSFDTTSSLGLLPGMVSPILQPHLVGAINGICYQRPEDRKGVTALASSPIDSILLRTADLDELILAYADANYFGFERKDRENYTFFRNTRSTDLASIPMIGDTRFQPLFPPGV